ncbi:MAG TPA: S46 family peptidase [Candidatus Polarisedimenticolaceae bacterium]|nr:S46 family peptidase [Candidatus Polarisedimenticolaceae bacterium]
MKALGVRVALAALVILSARPTVAIEGMWMPRQVPEASGLVKDAGLTIDAKAYSSVSSYPLNAVVSLGGCSASFVSPDGLIITNQHCVTGALQYNSTPERNLLETGYLAKTRADELPVGPGSRAAVTVAVNDVTTEIAGNIDPALSDRERFDVIDRRSKERVKACEKDGLRCRVASFFEGNKYFEIAQLEINDIRLVYTPAKGIGNFGGETDNWRWPRHTGDVGIYRAYVAPDGKAAPFAKENVPYHPKKWLKIDSKGVGPGDTIAVAGYPGNTRRLETYAEIKRMTEWTLPRQIKRNEEQIAILEGVAKSSPESSIKVANRIRGLNNSLTNARGKLQGLVASKVLDAKAAREKALTAWIDADPARRKEYGDVLPRLDALTAQVNETRLRDAALGGLTGMGSLLGAAQTIERLASARPKPDLERDPAYQERNWKRMREGQERMQKNIDLAADRAILRYNLLEAARLPEGARIKPVDDAVGLAAGTSEADAGRAIDAFLDKLYTGTKLADHDVRLAALDKSSADLAAMKDTMLDFAAALEPEWHAQDEREKTRDGLRSRLSPVYLKAMLQLSGGLLAPDANGTLRVTFGKVEGVTEKDGLMYLPQTTLAGIVEKNTGEGEFDAPQRELDAIAALRDGKAKTPFADPKLGDVPVNFLASVDTTGGNSGSAAMNSKGELIGLLFDGTFDTVASDIVFDPVRTRSILVDIRYVLWVMDAVDDADALLRELGVSPSR